MVQNIIILCTTVDILLYKILFFNCCISIGKNRFNKFRNVLIRKYILTRKYKEKKVGKHQKQFKKIPMMTKKLMLQ